MNATSTSPTAIAPAEAGASTTGTTPPVKRLISEQMFGTSQEIEIEHNGAIYRLRKTSLGKLILTK